MPSPLELRRVRLGRQTIAHASTGSGPHVFLLHGMAASSRWWRRHVEALARHHTVHLVDLIGFGASSGQPFVLTEMSVHLLHLMDRLGIGRARLVGHSLGGLVAADLAASQVERVERLMLVDSAALPFAGRRARHILNYVRALSQMPLAAVPIFLHDWLRAGPVVVLNAGRQILASDLGQKLNRIEAPTFVVSGEHDPVIPPQMAMRIAGKIPRARLALIAGAGHNPIWQQPRTFASLLEVFLTSPDPLHAELPPGVVDQSTP